MLYDGCYMLRRATVRSVMARQYPVRHSLTARSTLSTAVLTTGEQRLGRVGAAALGLPHASVTSTSHCSGRLTERQPGGVLVTSGEAHSSPNKTTPPQTPPPMTPPSSG